MRQIVAGVLSSVTIMSLLAQEFDQTALSIVVLTDRAISCVHFSGEVSGRGDSWISCSRGSCNRCDVIDAESLAIKPPLFCA